jgi:VIT1/CCC1 family predicted Fe2+/Mn2+ transporter
MSVSRTSAVLALLVTGAAGALAAQGAPRIHAIELTFAGGYF